MKEKTIGELAAVANVSVRALRHYDALGLVPPSGRSDAGYRLYDESAILRLQSVMVWRALGFPLDEIRDLLDEADGPTLEALELHRGRLVEQLTDIDAQIARVDQVIRKRREGHRLDDSDVEVIFEGFDPADFHDEAEQRWGDTDAWRESQRRTRRYGPTEFRAIQDEFRAWTADFAALAEAEIAPSHADAARLVVAHREHLERWFYRCPPEVHQGLAALYTDDPRFTKTFDAVRSGLATYIRAAVDAAYAPRPRRL